MADMFFVTEWLHTEGEGWAPDIPEGTGFCHLGGDSPASRWGIFKTRYDFNKDISPAVNVPVSTSILLHSAKGYPPAMALMKDTLNSSEADAKTKYHSVKELLAAGESALRLHLGREREARYVLTECKVGQPGYVQEGEFVWVVGWNPEKRKVRWVASDYEIYGDSIDDFALSEQEVEHLA